MNNNQDRQYAGPEEAHSMLLNGEIKPDPHGAQMRAQQYGGGATPQQQQVTYGSYAGSYSGGAQSGVQSGNVQSGAPNQPSYEELLQAYNNRAPKAYGQPIVAVRKDNRGNIQAFKLQNGAVLDYAQMFQASMDHQLSGIIVQANQQGEPILRSFPDAFSGNNLDQLPTF